jgi:MFS family permease
LRHAYIQLYSGSGDNQLLLFVFLSACVTQVLTAMVLFTFVVPIAGILADRGQPRVTATIVICVIAGATSVPMFLAFQTKKLVACWILQAVLLALTAYTMGLLPVICSSIYPAGVRISGFNLGYNLGRSRFVAHA